ncbi:MAG TPA: hypothetical protein VKB78_01115 [Pirellulales bacterium]|nr:hypothetical protein [Pirellulales bacterium]
MPSNTDLTSAALASRLELFFGEANEAEARVYARLPSDPSLEGRRLTGRLIGPECCFSKTLPATIPFIDRGPGDGFLAEAIVPDPCFWTPELPFLYRAILELSPRGGDVVYSSRSVVRTVITAAFGSEAQARRERDEYTTKTPRLLVDRPFAIRRLGAIGRSLYLDGKRWVPRGICVDQASQSDLAAARNASAALVLPAPDDAFCLEASRLGVPLFVQVAASLRDSEFASRRDAATCRSEIRRLAKWPAVFAIILDRQADLDNETLAAARNTPLATRLDAETSSPLPAWVQLAIFDIPQSDSSIPSLSGITIPIIAVRRLPHHESIATARAACDRLQFDLASIGDFGGYFV